MREHSPFSLLHSEYDSPDYKNYYIKHRKYGFTQVLRGK